MKVNEVAKPNARNLLDVCVGSLVTLMLWQPVEVDADIRHRRSCLLAWLVS